MLNNYSEVGGHAVNKRAGIFNLILLLAPMLLNVIFFKELHLEMPI